MFELHRRRVGARGVRRDLREPQPRQHRRSGRASSRSRRRRTSTGPSMPPPRAYASWRLVPAPRRAEILFRAAQLLRRAQGRVRARHDARNGQGGRRDRRRRPGSHRHGAADGGRGPAPARADDAVGAAQQVRDVGPAADRRLRDDHRLELPDGRAVVEDPAGARLRQHGGLQARRGSAALGDQLRPDARRRRRAAAASSTW